MKFSIVAVAAIICSCVLTSGCTTVMRGNPKGTPVTSEPTGADVFVDGTPLGETPVTIFATPPSFRNIDIEYPSFAPFRAKLTSALKRTIKPIYFLNIFWAWGLIIDGVTGSMYSYDYPFHVKLNPVQSEQAIDRLSHFRIPELIAPPGKSLLIVYREKNPKFNSGAERVYINGERTTLKRGQFVILTLPPGPCLVGVSQDEVFPVNLVSDSTTYCKYLSIMAGVESVSYKESRVKYLRVLTPLPEEKAIREVYYLIRNK